MFMTDYLDYFLVLGGKHVCGSVLWVFAQRANYATQLVITSTHITMLYLHTIAKPKVDILDDGCLPLLYYLLIKQSFKRCHIATLQRTGVVGIFGMIALLLGIKNLGCQQQLLPV